MREEELAVVTDGPINLYICLCRRNPRVQRCEALQPEILLHPLPWLVYRKDRASKNDVLIYVVSNQLLLDMRCTI